MGLFNRLFRKKANWEELDDTASIYPTPDISLLSFETEEGNTLSGWVDKSYVDYKFKQYCPYNFLIKINLSDHIANHNQDLDMANIEDYFTERLRTIGVTHLIARVATNEGLNMEFYLENYKAAKTMLGKLMGDSERLVSFTCEINDDPKWRAVYGLMNV